MHQNAMSYYDSQVAEAEIFTMSSVEYSQDSLNFGDLTILTLEIYWSFLYL